MCKFCESFDFGSTGWANLLGGYKVYFASHAGGVPEDERFKFCPVCGQDLSAAGAKEIKLEFVKHQEVDRDRKHYTRDTYTIDEYTVEVDDTTYMDDGLTIRSISVIRPFDRDGAKRYIPEINYNDEFFGSKEPRFEIQTTAYGSLKTDEYALFLDAQEKAVKVVEILTKEFITKKQREG